MWSLVYQGISVFPMTKMAGVILKEKEKTKRQTHTDDLTFAHANQYRDEKKERGDSGAENVKLKPEDALRSLPAFRLFNEQELSELLPLCTIQDYPAEKVLIKEGDPSDNRVFFMLEGEISIYMDGNFILGLKRAGDIFGEMGLISQEPRSATIKTDKPTTALVISSALSFDVQQEEYHKFRYYFSRMFNAILTDKLRMTSERAKMYEVAVKHSMEVTEHSASLEEQLHRNINQLQIYSHLVDSAKQAVLILNTSGQVLEANPFFYTEFGVDPATLTGKPVSQYLGLPGEGEGSWEAIAQKAKKDGWTGEVSLGLPKSPPIPMECTVSLVEDQEKDPLAFLVMLHDLREQKAYQEKILNQSSQLENANRELQELDRLKNNFLTLVSHELRTPTTSILAYSETLATEGMVDPEDRGEFIGIIHTEAKQLARLITKVLSVSKLESDQMAMDFSPGILKDVVTAVTGAMAHQAEEKNLKMGLEIIGEVQLTEFDGQKMEEVLSEIIDNAIKFSEEGEIQVRLEQNDKESLLVVSDTGKGMDGSVVSSAFSKFNWVEDVANHHKGIGLGLPLAHLLVRAHKGEMLLESEEGKGTVVRIRLPHEPR